MVPHLNPEYKSLMIDHGYFDDCLSGEENEEEEEEEEVVEQTDVHDSAGLIDNVENNKRLKSLYKLDKNNNIKQSSKEFLTEHSLDGKSSQLLILISLYVYVMFTASYCHYIH